MFLHDSLLHHHIDQWFLGTVVSMHPHWTAGIWKLTRSTPQIRCETNFSSLSFRDSERIGSRVRDTFRELKTDARTHDLEDVDSSGDECGPALRPPLRDIHLCTPCTPGHSRVGNDLWTADIYQQGCHDAAEPQDNPEYTFTR